MTLVSYVSTGFCHVLPILMTHARIDYLRRHLASEGIVAFGVMLRVSAALLISRITLH